MTMASSACRAGARSDHGADVPGDMTLAFWIGDAQVFNEPWEGFLVPGHDE